MLAPPDYEYPAIARGNTPLLQPQNPLFKSQLRSFWIRLTTPPVLLLSLSCSRVDLEPKLEKGVLGMWLYGEFVRGQVTLLTYRKVDIRLHAKRNSELLWRKAGQPRHLVDVEDSDQ